MNKKHETVVVVHPQGSEFEIDENIAPLVYELWKCNLKTKNTCENVFDAEYVWIQFLGEKSFRNFLKIVKMYGSNEVSHKAIFMKKIIDNAHCCISSIEYKNKVAEFINKNNSHHLGGDKWFYDIKIHKPIDFFVGSNTSIVYDVYFPYKDCEELLNIFINYNNN